jgi:hypothetical protein
MFSIIVLATTTVAVAGVNQLTALNDRETINTAERSMAATAATLDKIHQQRDPTRSVRLPLGTGGVWLNQTTLTIESPDISLTGTPFEDPIDVNSLEHRFDRNPEPITFAYEAGGAFRSNAGIERYEPAMRCTTGAGGDTVAVVSVVKLTSGDSIDIASGYRDGISIDPTDVSSGGAGPDLSRSLQIDARLRGTDRVVEEFSTTGEITVDVEKTAYPDQWIRYLRVAEGWDRQGPSSFEFSCEADRAVLRIVRVELSTPGF